jgi:predicted nucleic acid-binding protein
LYHVLQLAAASRCTAYDCEYVALAYALDVPLVTVDRQILSHFPERAIALDLFAGS